MNLPIVEKSLPTILMNYNNQMVIVRVDSSTNNIKSSRHIQRQLKAVRKMKTLRLLH
jgi:hypothetical protein